MSRRVLRTLAVVAVLAMVAAACSKKEATPPASGSASTGAPVEKIDVTVYFQGAWTGPYNYLVIPAVQGAQLRAKELNADPSYPANITVGTADTQGSGDNAPPVVQQVVADPNTVAVEGPAFSGESAASGDSYEQAQIPFVTPSATGVDLAKSGWTYWYRTVGNDDLQGGNDGDFLAQIVGAKKLFVANDKSAYGEPLSQTAGDAAKAAGVDIVKVEGVEPADDYSALISDIKASGADTVFYGGYDADFSKIVKQGVDAGLKVNWMSGDGSVSSTFLDIAGSAAEGVYLSISSNLGGDFTAKYNQEYGSKASTVPVYAAEGYDAMGVIAEGIKRAIEGGATTPTDIRAGIKTYLDSLTVDNPYVGVAKPIAFDPSTHELSAPDPAARLFFYQVTNGAMAPLGSAADVLT